MVAPAPGAGGLKAVPGAPAELVLTGWGGAKAGTPGAPGAWTVGPAMCTTELSGKSTAGCIMQVTVV